jgi:hypothetical protein
MTEEEKAAWLIERGWSTYYNPRYWVHPKTVADPSQQDYTNYGMLIDDAVAYENIGCPPHQPMGFPSLSRMDLAKRTKGLTEKV